jgi:hypothetical protein
MEAQRRGAGVSPSVYDRIPDPSARAGATTAGFAAAKVKRVRANPRVLLGPANGRGKPLGPLAEGSARVLPVEEQVAAERVVQSDHGLGRRVYEALLGSRAGGVAYVEVTAAR